MPFDVPQLLDACSRTRPDHEGAKHEAGRDPAAGRGGGWHTFVRVQEGSGSEDYPEEGDQTR